MSMKKLVIASGLCMAVSGCIGFSWTASGLCMAVSGCIGFSWTSKVDDGAIYELNREMYIAEEDGLILVDARTEHPVYCTIKGTLPAGTKLQEAEKITRRGGSFWWYFGPYSHVAVYGEVLEGDFKGSLVDFGEQRRFQRESCRLWRASPALSQARILVSVSA